MDTSWASRDRKRLVALTGATGFVGQHLCPAILNSGYRLRAISTRPRPPEWASPDLEWVRVAPFAENTDWPTLLSGGITEVVHLAAVAHRFGRNRERAVAEYERVNHLATSALAESVVKVGSVNRVVFISSIAVNGGLSEVPVTESSICRPETAYGRSKLAAEDAIRRILARTATDFCVLRPSLVYGAGNPGNMKRLLKLIRLRLPLPLASVRNRRTFLFVGNLIDAILLVLRHPAASRKTFCVSDGVEMSTPEFIRRLASASGTTATLLPFPAKVLELLGKSGTLLGRMSRIRVPFDGETLGKLCGSLSVDCSFLKKTCGWSPPFSVEEGIRRTIES